MPNLTPDELGAIWIEEGYPGTGTVFLDVLTEKGYDISKGQMIHMLRAFCDPLDIYKYRQQHQHQSRTPPPPPMDDDASQDEVDAAIDLSKRLADEVLKTLDPLHTPLAAPDTLPGNVTLAMPTTPPASRLEILSKVGDLLGQLANEDDPVLSHYVYDFSDEQEPLAVVWASCFHLGGRYTYVPLARRVLNVVLSHPRIKLALLGDNWEGFSPHFFNKKSMVDEVLPPRAQKQMFGAYFDLVQGSVIAGFAGQHDADWEAKNTGYSSMKDLFVQHSIPYFEGKGMLVLNVGDQQYRGMVAHRLPGSSIYNPLHAQMRAFRIDSPNGDFFVKGDSHQAAFAEQMVNTWEADAGLRPPFVQFIQTGTAKVGLDPYTMKGWSRGQSEYYATVFHPDYHELRTSRRFDDVVRWVQNKDWVVNFDNRPAQAMAQAD